MKWINLHPSTQFINTILPPSFKPPWESKHLPKDIQLIFNHVTHLLHTSNTPVMAKVNHNYRRLTHAYLLHTTDTTICRATSLSYDDHRGTWCITPQSQTRSINTAHLSPTHSQQTDDQYQLLPPSAQIWALTSVFISNEWIAPLKWMNIWKFHLFEYVFTRALSNKCVYVRKESFIASNVCLFKMFSLF